MPIKNLITKERIVDACALAGGIAVSYATHGENYSFMKAQLLSGAGAVFGLGLGLIVTGKFKNKARRSSKS